MSHLLINLGGPCFVFLDMSKLYDYVKNLHYIPCYLVFLVHIILKIFIKNPKNERNKIKNISQTQANDIGDTKPQNLSKEN